MILPAAVDYLEELASTLASASAAGLKLDGVEKTAREVGELVDDLYVSLEGLKNANLHTGGDDALGHARYMLADVIPSMSRVRDASDRLERVIPHDTWPLPTYTEILFVK
jgi:glutamine synthetase